MAAWLLVMGFAATAVAQGPEYQFPSSQQPPPPAQSAPAPGFASPVVHDVQIVGNRRIALSEIRGEISTRPGQVYRENQIEQDVRRLLATKKFLDVRVHRQSGPTPGTMIVVFEVAEYPRIEFIDFVGNEKVRSSALQKAVGIKVGEPMNRSILDAARKKILDFYIERGHNKVRVDVVQGLNPQDRGVAFKISEGPQQRVWSVSFEGNTIATDARLKTQIQSKPGILKYFFGGKVRRSAIEEDIDRFTSYYRSLGYFDAHVGRELKFSDDDRWLYLTFVIDEGPRYQIRNIVIRGNRIVNEQQLAGLMELKSGEFFDQAKLNKDHREIVDAYGGNGYIFADVNPSTRLLEQPGQLDLVFDIDEGDRYRVGRINVKIGGEHPHTRHTTVLNRISLQPGDIVDIREIRASERRLRASGLFLSDPATGASPRIVYHKPEKDSSIAKRNSPDGPPTYRGQSPDSGNSGIFLDIERVPP